MLTQEHVDLGMKKEFSYKGFCGSCIQDSTQDNEVIYWGKVLDIPHLITYEADEKSDMYKLFCEAVDDYLEGLQAEQDGSNYESGYEAY